MEIAVSYFLTGFPGFIATRIVRKLAEDHPSKSFLLLVHPTQMDKARRVVNEIASNLGCSTVRFTVAVGDITKDSLGLDPEILNSTDDITHAFHLAAIYDLAVEKQIAALVNITGTQNVTSWVKNLPNLERYVYFSTAYVSGNRKGTILETELIDVNGFKNFYESTKFEAELIVKQSWDEIPTTILRPGVVMGDSKSGVTDKFDGPYFVMRFLDRFARFPIPYLGHGDALFNVVPVDYVVDATCELAHYPGGVHKVYHLTDPSPHSAKEAYRLICEAQLGKTPKITIPLSVVAALMSISAFRRWLGVEKETLAYFRIGPKYDSSQAKRDLDTLGISCPDFSSYIKTATGYFLEHKSDPDKAVAVT